MAQKFILALGLMAVAVLAVDFHPGAYVNSYAAPVNKSHNMVIGYRLPGDRLVYSEDIVKKSSLWQIVTVQKTFNTSRFDIITMVEARDLKTDGTGAYASVLNGGPGHRNVTLRFKSQRNHGIHFTVRIYARP